MSPSKVIHRIHKRGGRFVVYRIEETGNLGSGSPVYEATDFEDARKKLYELNGWKYKPNKTEGMAVLQAECTVDRSKRPQWMTRLMHAISNVQWKRYDGTEDELKGIRSGIDHFIRQIKLSDQTSLDLVTDITKEQVLQVKKNGKTFINVWFKHGTE